MPEKRLADNNVRLLRQGLELIDLLDDERYGHRSTVKRELSYLAMHDIHHYAIVGLLLSSMDVPLPPGFGMAPSTLHFHGRA